VDFWAAGPAVWKFCTIGREQGFFAEHEFCLFGIWGMEKRMRHRLAKGMSGKRRGRELFANLKFFAALRQDGGSSNG